MPTRRRDGTVSKRSWAIVVLRLGWRRRRRAQGAGLVRWRVVPMTQPLSASASPKDRGGSRTPSHRSVGVQVPAGWWEILGWSLPIACCPVSSGQRAVPARHSAKRSGWARWGKWPLPGQMVTVAWGSIALSHLW